MKRSDYVLLFVSYLLGVLYTFISKHSYATNPFVTDYLVGGIGSLLAMLLMSSIFTLPVQFFSGWNKFGYIRKTIITSLVLYFILISLKLI